MNRNALKLTGIMRAPDAPSLRDVTLKEEVSSQETTKYPNIAVIKIPKVP